MAQTMRELQRIKGIGTVFAQRFLDAGYDTFAKIAAAGEAGLSNIRGMNAPLVKSILPQARQLAGSVDKIRTAEVELVKQKAASVTHQVQDIGLHVQKRFQKEAAGKRGKKIKKEIARILASLEAAGDKLETKVKKTGKVLNKAEKKLADLSEAGLKGLGKGLKKTRKSLNKKLPK